MKTIYLLLTIFLLSFVVQAQKTSETLLQIADKYWVQPDIVYNVANNTQLKLDVWYPRDNAKPTPTLVYIHGGGWIFGSKEGAIFQALPYLEKGWRVVNVEYRMASNSLAPAAVEDTRCALRWVYRNAKMWNFDTSKIVLTGHSAGGHLSLITGMLPDGTALDNNCYADEKYGDVKMHVAAIINWFGITDVTDMLEDGGNPRGYAIEWVGNRNDTARIATRASPLTYVRAGLPPILTIHGDADTLVPVAHARRLHEALQKAGTPSELIVIPGGGHGGFNPQQVRDIDAAIRAFLTKNGILK